jgi:hypothetical protein
MEIKAKGAFARTVMYPRANTEPAHAIILIALPCAMHATSYLLSPPISRVKFICVCDFLGFIFTQY